MLKKLMLFCNVIIFQFLSYSQKEASIWILPNANGIAFGNDSAIFIGGSQLGENETSTSICDSSGSILFYSNGILLFNKFNKLVKNGTNLGFPIGNYESTSRQGSLLIKHPDNDSIIYLFSTDYQGRNGGLCYSKILVHGNQDSGLLTEKRVKLLSPVDEAITAVNHQNGRDIWVIVHGFGNSNFYAFLLTKYGVLSCIRNSSIGLYHSGLDGTNAQVNLKVSPNGKYITHHQLRNWNTEIFNFNSLNGKIQNKITGLNSMMAIGFEYSASSSFLYISSTSPNGLFQINLANKNTANIKNYNYNLGPVQLQLGIDRKIYSTNGDSKDLFIINDPDSIGNKCNITTKLNFLSNKNFSSVPNFNQSYFYTPSINYTYQLNCNSNTIDALAKDTFKASGFKWRCRKQFSSDTFSLVGNAQSLHYYFSDSGTYWLQLIAFNNLRSDTSIKSIVIYPAIPQRFLGNDTILAAGSTFSKLLQAPSNAFCNRWLLNDTLIASSDSLPASKFGTYICQSTNPSFCLVSDTIVLIPCIDSLALPVITRSRDSLLVANYFTDSLTWFKNGVLCKTSCQNFIHLNDSGLYSVMLVRNGHCPKVSLPYKVTSVCLDTLPVPIISRSRDSLFVSNFIGDTLQWFNNGVLVHTSASNFIHLNTTGTYRASITKDFHCTKSSADYTVTSLCIDSLKTPVISRKNDSLLVLNLLADSFVWYKNSSNIQNSTSNALALNDTGTYSVVAYKKYLCPHSSDDYKVHQLSTETVNHSDELIRLFPNPSDGIVYFTCPLPFTLIVTDALGKTVHKQQEVLPVNLPKGIYLFRFILHQQVIIKKVVVV